MLTLELNDRERQLLLFTLEFSLSNLDYLDELRDELEQFGAGGVHEKDLPTEEELVELRDRLACWEGWR